MNREAFEAEARKHGFILDRLDKSGVYVQLITEQAWSIWQAATAAALERAAVACESLGMTTSGIYERNHECASAIRALKESKE
jgi:hypothetical protein